jgi:energy-coupling factor transporter ATP-binding protein EcfA2
MTSVDIDQSFIVNFRTLCSDFKTHYDDYVNKIKKLNLEKDIWLLMGPSGCGKTTSFVRLTTDITPVELKSKIIESKSTKQQVLVAGSIIGAGGTSTTISPNPVQTNDGIIIDMAGFETDKNKEPIIHLLNSMLVGYINKFKILLFMDLGDLNRGVFERYKRELIKIFGAGKFDHSTENVVLVFTKVKDSEPTFRLRASRDGDLRMLMKEELFSQMLASVTDQQLCKLIGACIKNFCLLECQDMTKQESFKELSLTERKISDLNPKDFVINLSETQNRFDVDGDKLLNWYRQRIFILLDQKNKIISRIKNHKDSSIIETARLNDILITNENLQAECSRSIKEMKMKMEELNEIRLTNDAEQNRMTLKIQASRENDSLLKDTFTVVHHTQIQQLYPNKIGRSLGKDTYKLKCVIGVPLGCESIRITKSLSHISLEKMNELKCAHYDDVKLEGTLPTREEAYHRDGFVEVDLEKEDFFVIIIIMKINCAKSGSQQLVNESLRSRTKQLETLLNQLITNRVGIETKISETRDKLQDFLRTEEELLNIHKLNSDEKTKSLDDLKEILKTSKLEYSNLRTKIKTILSEEILIKLTSVVEILNVNFLKVSFNDHLKSLISSKYYDDDEESKFNE